MPSPRVCYQEYKDLLNYGNYSGGFKSSIMPGMSTSEGLHLLAISEVAATWVAPEGCIEILGTEYHELKSQVDAA